MPVILRDKYIDVSNLQVVFTIKNDLRVNNQRSYLDSEEVIYEGRWLPSLDMVLQAADFDLMTKSW